jgi:cysteinyl-tRNA synthetase
MDDDFNSGGAIGALFGLIRDLNQYFTAAGPKVVDPEPLDQARALLEEGNQILSLFPAGLRAVRRLSQGGITPEVKALVQKRDQARQAKDWALADELREKIQDLGFAVEDGPEGTQVHPIS